MKQIALDTETTGLDAQEDRIIEIACVEISGRRITENNFHCYLNPERDIAAEAFQVHGISRSDLEDKPLFANICDQLLEYADGAEIFIHNAEFDLAFLDEELARIGRGQFAEETGCTVIDTLKMARDRHPGLKNSLNEICKRYNISIAERDKHSALLDATLLAHAYLAMTGGQTLFELQRTVVETASMNFTISDNGQRPLVLYASTEELEAHREFMDSLQKA